MSNEQSNQLNYRNPLFNATVVIRALKTLLESNDMLLDIIENSDHTLLGLKGADFIRLAVALKVDEITDELTLERLTA
jgi:hypothetical protein